MENEEFELTEPERTALAALPREVAPSDLLEERIVRELRTAGYIGAPAARQWRQHALRVAAAVMLFVGGAATGRYLLTPNDAKQQSAAATVDPSGSSAGSGSSASSGAPASRAQTTTPVRNGERTVAQREMWL